jgi:hypothetical protein
VLEQGGKKIDLVIVAEAEARRQVGSEECWKKYGVEAGRKTMEGSGLIYLFAWSSA